MNDHYKVKQKQWKELRDFLASWWYNIDFQALLVILSTYVSHFYLKESPVWLLVLGASGTGKSAVAIRSVESLDCVYPLADVTPKTFLSGYAQSGGGLLERITREQGGNAVFSLSDMSMLTSKRPDTVGEILAILRKMYDGSYSKITGMQQEELNWEGKITCIAAGTFDVERHWAMHRSLGERFVQLAWKQGNTPEAFERMAECTAKQIGNEEHIKANLKRLVREFVDRDNLVPVPTETLRKTILKLVPLTRLVSLLRTPIQRETLGSKRNVIEVTESEGTARVMKVFANIARGSATLFRREDVCKDDLKLAYRVGFDSVPRDRQKVVALLASLQARGKRYVGCTEISRRTRIPKTTLVRVIEDLHYLRVVKISTVDDVNYPHLTSDFSGLLSKALNVLK